jgi:hypothetical protein
MSKAVHRDVRMRESDEPVKEYCGMPDRAQF